MGHQTLQLEGRMQGREEAAHAPTIQPGVEALPELVCKILLVPPPPPPEF